MDGKQWFTKTFGKHDVVLSFLNLLSGGWGKEFFAPPCDLLARRVR